MKSSPDPETEYPVKSLFYHQNLRKMMSHKKFSFCISLYPNASKLKRLFSQTRMDGLRRRNDIKACTKPNIKQHLHDRDNTYKISLDKLASMFLDDTRKIKIVYRK
jgi:hypothetical protein